MRLKYSCVRVWPGYTMRYFVFVLLTWSLVSIIIYYNYVGEKSGVKNLKVVQTKVQTGESFDNMF